MTVHRIARWVDLEADLHVAADRMAELAGTSKGHLLGELLENYAADYDGPDVPPVTVEGSRPARVYLDDATWQRARRRARSEGLSVSAAVNQLVRDAEDEADIA